MRCEDPEGNADQPSHQRCHGHERKRFEHGSPITLIENEQQGRGDDSARHRPAAAQPRKCARGNDEQQRWNPLQKTDEPVYRDKRRDVVAHRQFVRDHPSFESCSRRRRERRAWVRDCDATIEGRDALEPASNRVGMRFHPCACRLRRLQVPAAHCDHDFTLGAETEF